MAYLTSHKLFYLYGGMMVLINTHSTYMYIVCHTHHTLLSSTSKNMQCMYRFLLK